MRRNANGESVVDVIVVQMRNWNRHGGYLRLADVAFGRNFYLVLTTGPAEVRFGSDGANYPGSHHLDVLSTPNEYSTALASLSGKTVHIC